MSAGDPVRAIADAVLYEGYVLWPYRRSALKNAQRWTFGGVYPPAHHAGRAPGDDPCTMRAECLVEGAAQARLDATVRFLHVVRRQALDADGRAVDALETPDGERHLTWDEAAEREVVVPAASLAELAAAPRRRRVELPVGGAREPLAGGALERTWEPLDGSVALAAEPLAPGLHRVALEVENTTPFPAGGERGAALRRTLCATHAVLRLAGPQAAFVSQTDPPQRLRAAAEGCVQEGAWPVLVGAEGARDALLVSPIILPDHPRVAPESPGDLFDGGEIDQLLTLSILAMTDAEKAEARGSDPRVRAILERTEALTSEQLMRLHGTIRELQVRR